MKRIFCDCCGNEFEYNDALKPLSGETTPVELRGKAGTILSKMTVVFKDIDKVVGGAPTTGVVGYTFDLCKDCRLDIIKNLDTRPVVEPAAFKPIRMSAPEIEAVFTKHGGGAADSYFVTKAKAFDIYRAVFKHITGGGA